ncbi:hypothetical protein EW146_g4488 [Bondarzewia mesenterica]|uniref:ABC transmembrane type-1 domain-containing protein n=1 Tax=Bondarzewia mesenterica TaxID=1095465 RepID=A0A4S4LUM3_9AGAM|nr:hypothetical protein EW146_g4488 [Bondarzewia mesenterica]
MVAALVSPDARLDRLALRPKNPPPPAPVSLDEAEVIPLVNTSILSQLTYTWINDIMVLGYQRTLQATDLWKLDESREVHGLSEMFDKAWARRMQEAEDWNARLASGEINPGVVRRTVWSVRALGHGRGRRARRKALEADWRERGGRKQASLAWALNDMFGWSFWIGGCFKVLGNVVQLMGPILVKAIINFGKETLAAQGEGKKPPNIRRGVGMAIGLFCLTALTSVCQHQVYSYSHQGYHMFASDRLNICAFTHQFFWRSMTTGVLARGALTSCIYKRGGLFTPKARTQLSNAEIVNHISSDVSRVDACAQWFHGLRLFRSLSVLSSFASNSRWLLPLSFHRTPSGTRHAMQFKIRKESMKWTDRRARLLLEVLGAMRVVKYFTYELPLLQRIFHIRKNELKGVRKIQNARSANIAFAYSIPVLAASLSFVMYTATSKEFDSAIIFSSLSLFQLLRQPMMFLPRALSAITDADNALVRVANVFSAETMSETPITTVLEQELGIKVVDATFEWEEGRAADEKNDGKGGKEKQTVDVSVDTLPVQRRPFQVRNVSMEIPRGEIAAVVGPVGSGKRDNILFGQPFDEEKYWKVIEYACLLTDLEVLPGGDMTEIGEKGINLSGGQKQRPASLSYNPRSTTVHIFKTIDAHVGRSLSTNAIVSALRGQGKTVILVTHALHFVPQCDYIYALNNGHVAEQGTYQELLARSGDQLGVSHGGKWLDHWALIILFMVLMQGSQLMNSYTLVWWPANRWNRPSSFYQTLYACLGIAQALFTFALGLSMDVLSFHVSQNLHHHVLRNISFAPMSFFDTRPLGRIISVFGKDFDSIDNQLPATLQNTTAYTPTATRGQTSSSNPYVPYVPEQMSAPPTPAFAAAVPVSPQTSGAAVTAYYQPPSAAGAQYPSAVAAPYVSSSSPVAQYAPPLTQYTPITTQQPSAQYAAYHPEPQVTLPTPPFQQQTYSAPGAGAYYANPTSSRPTSPPPPSYTTMAQ